MAECATIPSCGKLQLQRNCVGWSHFIPSNASFRIVKRKPSYGNHRVLLEVCGSSVPTATSLGRHLCLKRSSFRCFCFGAFVNPDATLSNWAPLVDQALLLASMMLAYMAGVVPSKMSTFTTGKNISDHDALPANSISSGSGVRSGHQANTNAWGEIKGKLLDALDAMQRGGNLDNSIECEKYTTKRPLSLYAVNESPRLRLLLATAQKLEKEVNSISGNYQNVGTDDWLTVLTEIIKKSSQSLCVAWLEEELYLQNRKHDKEALLAMLRNSKADDNVLRNIRRSGKEDLYVDLLYFLRFGPLRISGHYDSKLVAGRGVDILEDLVITLAEGITSSYLEIISVDSSISDEMNRLGLILCSLSTRALQRLRNEVALKQWINQNMESVVSMYEDRFDLNTLRVQLVEESTMSQTGKLNWWKKLTFGKQASTSSPLCYLVISQISMFVKRTKELRDLRGWRYYFSLFLEFSDIAMPLVRVIFAKVSNAISFFLVCLIGRSLGLIYTGIRQSLGWR